MRVQAEFDDGIVLEKEHILEFDDIELVITLVLEYSQMKDKDGCVTISGSIVNVVGKSSKQNVCILIKIWYN